MISQIRKLKTQFAVEFEFLAYELFPEGLEYPPDAPAPVASQRPRLPSRFQLAAAAEGVSLPKVERPHQMRTHLAHETVLVLTALGRDPWPIIERLYTAYWQHGTDLAVVENLWKLVQDDGLDEEDFRAALGERRFAEQIIGFDEAAYASGVYNVPTYFVGGERFAEQPYTVLEAAVRKALNLEGDLGSSSVAGRPWVGMNMVSTIDGKTITGSRDEAVADLGSALDHRLMRALEGKCDAVLLGAGTLRATPGLNYPEHLLRIVATQSGSLDFGQRFFRDPGRVLVLAPTSAELDDCPCPILRTDGCWETVLTTLFNDFGVQHLLVEGGSELNASLLAQDVVDELFLTIAPKVKLGRETPTYAGGEPLGREDILPFRLVHATPVGNEVFLRYARDEEAKARTSPSGVSE